MRALERAAIIAVGSELLTPHRLDTNSLFLTGRLHDYGLVVPAKFVVGDSREDLAALLEVALGRADLVVTTGGLGPTADDVTRDVVAGVLGLPLEADEALLAELRQKFARRGLRMPDINRRQALVPRGATPLANPNGTAPGLIIEAAERLVVLLPGPPRELQPMFDAAVVPLLAARTEGVRLRRRALFVAGRTESQVEEVAHPIYAGFAEREVPIDTTILATAGQIELHLLARGPDTVVLDAALDAAVQELSQALGPAVFSTDGRTLAAVVGAQLAARNWRLAAAESCTGGLFVARLTDVPGSSEWVEGGVVAYANAVKTRELGVPADLLASHGAVSAPVAVAMADGVRARLGAEVGVGITGIAGPGGGSAEKPVGTVVVAVVTPERREVKTLSLPGERATVRARSVAAALDLVRRLT